MSKWYIFYIVISGFERSIQWIPALSVVWRLSIFPVQSELFSINNIPKRVFLVSFQTWLLTVPLMSLCQLINHMRS